MFQIDSSAEISIWSKNQKKMGKSIAFVPTMGSLHSGHSSLISLAKKKADLVIVSIYVNPLQFGPNEDFDRYPRPLEKDLAMCKAHGADLVFTPKTLYDPDFSTTVRVKGLTERLCGDHRPGHFDGVTTVVARLFGIIKPDLAIFGEKDYQQLMVIKRMTQDLGLSPEILGAPLIRDPDGLAMSSRNIFLTPHERTRALTLYKALNSMKTGSNIAQTRISNALNILDLDKLDYLEIVDENSLEPIESINKPSRALIAGYIGKTRLIDNIQVMP